MINILITVFEILSTVAFPLGQFARFSFYNQQVNIYAYEIFMAAAFVLLFMFYRRAPFIRIGLSRYILYFLGSLVISFLITASSFDRYSNMVGILYLLRLCFYFLHFLYFAHHISVYKTGRKHLSFELYLIVIVLAVSSWLQYIFYPNLRNLLYMGWDPHLYRVFGFFFEPYLAGAALGLALYFIYFHGYGLKKYRYLLLSCLFILIMLTFSRTVYAAVMISLFALFIQKRKYKLLLLTAVSFVVLAFAIPKPVGVGVQLLRTFSVETRIRNAGEGLSMWKKYPVFGVGYNRIRYAKARLGLTGKLDSSHAAASYHSSFITILASGGILSLAAFALLLWKAGRISTASGYYLLFLSILSMGDNALLHTFILYYCLKLLAFESVQSSLE